MPHVDVKQTFLEYVPSVLLEEDVAFGADGRAGRDKKAVPEASGQGVTNGAAAPYVKVTTHWV
ncbi:hypothetical protein NE857_03435 [Nocardiopsis exhalans]|uniref:Uncharacterized protein n=1 Tax=Nocardiopsis exhalans TaxID=163604 RepID=A0ABY5DBX7_9ACTN|nr:hypothetical protein [Nocardiopsis exhalans]USY20723.1 hypothetical protein NE857_03435 [Nocardiopsis exhalans]